MAGSVMVPYNWRFLVLEKLGERYKKLTNNTYITYFVGWMVGYILVLYLEYKSVIKNLLSKA